MAQEDYYPLGAYRDPSAPWNEPYVQERDFDLCVDVTLTRDVTIRTSSYCPEYCEEDGQTYANTEDTDWRKEYEENCYTIPQLLGELEKYIKKDIEAHKETVRGTHLLKGMLEACQGWKVVELAVEEL